MLTEVTVVDLQTMSPVLNSNTYTYTYWLLYSCIKNVFFHLFARVSGSVSQSTQKSWENAPLVQNLVLIYRATCNNMETVTDSLFISPGTISLISISTSMQKNQQKWNEQIKQDNNAPAYQSYPGIKLCWYKKMYFLYLAKAK